MTKYHGISKDGFVDSFSIVAARKKVIQWVKTKRKEAIAGTQMIYKMPNYQRYGRVIFGNRHGWSFIWEKCEENGDEVAIYVLNENGTLGRLIRKYRR